jgi:quercetin dioxygenase-like cupin family protein
VQHDGERVRVTQWRIAPGEATGWHRHDHDYVVVPVTAGTLVLDDGRSATEAELEPGRSYVRAAGLEHDVRNGGDGEIVFVEIELKG